jgi:hypothetical protein
MSYFPAAAGTLAQLQFMADDMKGDYLASLFQPG